MENETEGMPFPADNYDARLGGITALSLMIDEATRVLDSTIKPEIRQLVTTIDNADGESPCPNCGECHPMTGAAFGVPVHIDTADLDASIMKALDTAAQAGACAALNAILASMRAHVFELMAFAINQLDETTESNN